MVNRAVVYGPTSALDAVRRALPSFIVDALEFGDEPNESNSPFVLSADCVFVAQSRSGLSDAGKRLVGHVPLVVLLLEGHVVPDVPDDPSWDPAGTELPYAHYDNAHELRLATRCAIAGFQAPRFFKELAGPWMHDARGALGVAQLALKIMAPSNDPSSPVQKLDNAVTRLGWLIERLPTQYALSVDLPDLNAPASMVFPSLQRYVDHLRRVQPRRPIDLREVHEAAWAANRASEQLVPYASAFADLAFSLSPARSPLVISVLEPQTIAVESECPDRRPPFHGETTMAAADLRGQGIPYRLLEVARLARRTGAHLQIEFTARGFAARAELPPSSSGQG